MLETDSALLPVGGDNLVALLPLLEKPRVVVERELRSAAAATSITTDILASFPVEDVLVTALQSQSEYWQGLALEWLPVSVEGRLRASVESVEKTGASQRIRHHAKRLLHSRHDPNP